MRARSCTSPLREQSLRREGRSGETAGVLRPCTAKAEAAARAFPVLLNRVSSPHLPQWAGPFLGRLRSLSLVKAPGTEPPNSN